MGCKACGNFILSALNGVPTCWLCLFVCCQLGRLIATHVEFKSCGKTSTEHPCITFRYFSGTGYKYVCREAFNLRWWGRNSILSSDLHVRPIGRACRWEGEIATNYPPKYFTPRRYSIFDWFVSDIDAPTNRITECSFHDTLNAAIIAYVLLGGSVFPHQREWCILCVLMLHLRE